MQRILRINVQSRNQALKQARKKARDEYLKDWKDYKQRHVATEQQKNAYVKAEKVARRQDWVMGALAPKRDVGTKQGFYGTVQPILASGPVFPPKVRKGPKGEGWDKVGQEGRPEEQKEWEGFGNEGNIVEGDRVVVIRGKPELVGQIGTIKELAKDSKDVKVEGLNMADVEIPVNFPQYRDKVFFQTIELPIPIENVRLIHRLTDTETGKDRDVVVKLIRGGAPYIEKQEFSSLPRHTRYIAGEDIEIPWPAETVPGMQGYDGDTSRYEVENKSFVPSLYAEPVPAAAFEELTFNQKYKSDRKWHDDEYVRMKVLEDVRAQWYMQRKIQGPLDTLREVQRQEAAQRTEELKAQGMPLETQSLINQHMQFAIRQKTKFRRRTKDVS